MQGMEAYIEQIARAAIGQLLNPLVLGALVAASLALLTGLAGTTACLVADFRYQRRHSLAAEHLHPLGGLSGRTIMGDSKPSRKVAPQQHREGFIGQLVTFPASHPARYISDPPSVLKMVR